MKLFTFLLLCLILYPQSGKSFPFNAKNYQLSSLWEKVSDAYPENLDTAAYFATQQKILALEVGNEEYYRNAVWSLGMINFKLSKYEDAVKYLYEANSLFTAIGDQEKSARCLYNIGAIFSKGKDFNNALLFFNESLAINSALGKVSFVAKAHYEIARCQIELKDFNEAEKHLNLCISINDPNDNASLTSMAHNYLGANLMNQEKYHEAISEYKLAVESARGISNFKKKSAIAYNNIGEVYLKLGDKNLAAENLNKALALKEEIGNPDLILSTVIQISRMEIENGNVKEGLAKLEKAIVNADNTKVNIVLQSALDYWVKMGEKYQNKVEMSSASLLTCLKIQNNQVAQMRHLNDKLDNLKNQYLLKSAFETHQLSQTNEFLSDRLFTTKILLVFFGLLVIVFTGISYIYLKKYKVLNSFKQETTLGMELITHQLERTIQIANRHK